MQLDHIVSERTSPARRSFMYNEQLLCCKRKILWILCLSQNSKQMKPWLICRLQLDRQSERERLGTTINIEGSIKSNWDSLGRSGVLLNPLFFTILPRLEMMMMVSDSNGWWPCLWSKKPQEKPFISFILLTTATIEHYIQRMFPSQFHPRTRPIFKSSFSSMKLPTFSVHIFTAYFAQLMDKWKKKLFAILLRISEHQIGNFKQSVRVGRVWQPAYWLNQISFIGSDDFQRFCTLWLSWEKNF